MLLLTSVTGRDHNTPKHQSGQLTYQVIPLKNIRGKTRNRADFSLNLDSIAHFVDLKEPFCLQDMKDMVSQEGCVAVWNADYSLSSCGCTKSTTLINFQYRFLNRILLTNSFLTKIGIKQDPNCSFCRCRNTAENLVHLFQQRSNVNQQTFQVNLTDKLDDCDFIPRDYSKDIAVFGPRVRQL